MEFPVLDFDDFTSGVEKRRTTFANAIVQSFETYGFVKIVNHGMSKATIGEAFDWVS